MADLTDPSLEKFLAMILCLSSMLSSCACSKLRYNRLVPQVPLLLTETPLGFQIGQAVHPVHQSPSHLIGSGLAQCSCGCSAWCFRCLWGSNVLEASQWH